MYLDKLISEYAKVYDQNLDCCVNAASAVSVSVRRQQRWADIETLLAASESDIETVKCCHSVATLVPMSIQR